jgi:hypothetical protein
MATATPARKRGNGLWIGIGAAVVVAGGLAFLLLGRSTPTKQTHVAAMPGTPLPTETPPSDPTPPEPSNATGSSEPSNATGDSAPPEIEFDVDDTGTTGTTRPTTGTTGTTGTARPTTGTTGTTRPTTGTTGATTRPVGTKPTTTVEAPVAADGCDKVSCVIDAYARPCCEQYRPKKPGDLPNELDRAMITSGMGKAKAAVIRCGELTPTAKGIVRLAMKVTPDGAVAEAGVSETPDAALGECVSSAVRKVTFAKTELGGEFVYPFKF